jgi:predicted RNase H-like nuclease
MITFIGIDLAWRSDRNHTGIAALSGDRSGAEVVALGESIRTLSQVQEFIARHASASSVVAVDAPLIIPNEIGQRACETAVGSRYGNRDASCHTSNRHLYPDASSVVLADNLLAQGYRHAPGLQKSDGVVLEVYPHAAMVALFDLPKILKYKKGTLAKRRLGLADLAALIRRLYRATPALVSNERLEARLSQNLEELPGTLLKLHEDVLDAIFCAYLAYYFWYWGPERNEVFGEVETGYIINPTLLSGGIEKHAA